jgi:hypothetical protein
MKIHCGRVDEIGLIVRGPGAGRVGEVDWCLEHEQMFYAEHEGEYLN